MDDLIPDNQDEDDSTIASVRNIYRRSFLKSEKKKVKETLEAKTDKSMMKGLETYNKSRIHEEKSSEDFDGKLRNTPKTLLKKCRNCNFKRKACLMNSTLCKARQKHSFACKKNWSLSPIIKL